MPFLRPRQFAAFLCLVVGLLSALSSLRAATVVDFSAYTPPYTIPSGEAILGSGGGFNAYAGRPSWATNGTGTATVAATAGGNRLTLNSVNTAASSNFPFAYLNSPTFNPTTATAVVSYSTTFKITSTSGDRLYFGLYAGAVRSSAGYNLNNLGNGDTSGLAQSTIGLGFLIQGSVFRVTRTGSANQLQSWNATSGAWSDGLANSGIGFLANTFYRATVTLDPVSGNMTIVVSNLGTAMNQDVPLFTAQSNISAVGTQGKNGGLHFVFGEAAYNTGATWTAEVARLVIGVETQGPAPLAPGENSPQRGYLNVVTFANNIADYAGVPAGLTNADINLASPAAATANHTALQLAIDYAIGQRLVLYFPSQTYYVDDTLWVRTTADSANGVSTIDNEHAILVGATNGASRPVLKLPPGLAAFNFTPNPAGNLPPKAVVSFVHVQTGAGDTEPLDNDQMFYDVLRGIDIDTGGNTGAVGLYMDMAQHSTLENCRVVATGSYAGLYGVPNHSSGIINVEVQGGSYGIYHVHVYDYAGGMPLYYNSGATLVGVKLFDQTVSAIQADHFVPITLTGFHIRNTSAHPALAMLGGTIHFGVINLIDGIIEMGDPNQVAISNNSASTSTPPRNIYLRNVYVTGTDKLVSYVDWNDPAKPVITTTLAGAAPWRKIAEYAFCAQGDHTVDGTTVQSYNVIDGAVDRVPERHAMSLSGYVPADLLTRHLWHILPSVDDPDIHVFTLADSARLNDPSYDTADQLQAAINAYPKIFLPTGAYYIGKTIVLKSNTALFGAGRAFTQIRTTPTWLPTAPVAAVTTVDDANATTYLGDLTIGVDMFYLQNAYFTNLEWKAGRHSTVNIGPPEFWRQPASYGDPQWVQGQAIDNVRITGNGGGRWYFFAASSETRNLNAGYRNLRISATHEPLSFYGLNMEHARGDIMCEITNSANIRIFTLKTEYGGDIDNQFLKSQPNVSVRDTTNFLLVGSGAQRSGPGANRGTVEFYFSDSTSYGAIVGALLPQAIDPPNDDVANEAGNTLLEQVNGTTTVAVEYLDQLAVYKRNAHLVDDNLIYYVAPTVALTSPASGASFPAFPTTVTAAASDPDGAVAVVEFAANGTFLADDSSSPFNAVWSPTAAGSYALTAVATDNDFVSATSTPVEVTITNSVPTLDPLALPSGVFGAAYSQALTATGGDGALTWTSAGTLPAGLTLSSAGVLSGVPTTTGSYSFSVTVADADLITGPADEGTRTYTITIEPIVATVTLGNLVQYYDGAPKPVSVATTPSGLDVMVTYNGGTAVPSYPGAYVVQATVTSSGYTGAATATLEIVSVGLVRHGSPVNGSIAGSLQVLLGENLTLNNGASISGDLLVPGTPTITLNGNPTYGGTLDASGSSAPADYQIMLNNGSSLAHVVRRVDPVALPSVSAPPAPASTRDVSINSANESPGDFTTLRNLTLNNKAGTVAVPPGTYGTFIVNNGSALVLGTVDAAEPAIYNLQDLTLNGGPLQIAGPVILTLANSATFNSTAGNAAHPEWFVLMIASGGLTLNNSATTHAIVLAPSGTVTLNAPLYGRVQSDRLILNSKGALMQPTP